MGSTLGVGMVVFFFLLSLSGMIGKDFKLAHSGAIANDTSAVVDMGNRRNCCTSTRYTTTGTRDDEHQRTVSTPAQR